MSRVKSPFAKPPSEPQAGPLASLELPANAQVGQLYGAHQHWLTGWLYRRSGCQQTAKDLVQDVFVRLLGKTYLPPLPEPRGYLARIAQGLLVDQRRRKRIEQAWLESQACLPEPLQISAEEQLLVLDALARVDALLEGLKPRARQAFLLSRLEGLSYPLIAEQLGVSLSTVEKDIAQALRHCYQELME